MRALAAGARQLSPFEIEWEVQGNCTSPVERTLWARKVRPVTHIVETWENERPEAWEPEEGFDDWKINWGVRNIGRDLPEGPYCIWLTVRCRKCDKCRAFRGRLWRERALAEVNASIRTWFGTITLSPEWQAHFGMRAALEVRRKKVGVTLENLPLNEQLWMRHKFIGAEFTNIFKRMRKSGLVFRYLMVLEAHKSGLPHYHMLIHEIGNPIVKKRLDCIWPFGFVQWRLAEREHAFYVCKYISKSNASRVRASLRYGGSSLST